MLYEQGLHSASAPGILSLDIHAADTSKILTGGNDKNATVFNKDTEQVIAILKGHTKRVTSVIYHPQEVCLNCSIVARMTPSVIMIEYVADDQLLSERMKYQFVIFFFF